MKNRLYFFLSIPILCFCIGCGKPSATGLDKPIVEDLKWEELTEIAKMDSLYGESRAYKKSIEWSQWLHEDEERLQRYGSVTYRDVKDFFALNEDTVFLSLVAASIGFDYREESEYQRKHGLMMAKADSVVQYWENVKAEQDTVKLKEIPASVAAVLDKKGTVFLIKLYLLECEVIKEVIDPEFVTLGDFLEALDLESKKRYPLVYELHKAVEHTPSFSWK